MNPLLILLIIPLLTIVGIAFVNDLTKVRLVSAIGMSAQLVFAFILLYLFYQQRNAGNTDVPSKLNVFTVFSKISRQVFNLSQFIFL